MSEEQQVQPGTPSKKDAADKGQPPRKQKVRANPLDTTNILFKLTFEWMTGFIFRGAWRPLEMDDLFELRKSHKADVINKQFTTEWEKRKKGKFGLLSTMFKLFGVQFVFSGVLKVFADVCSLAGPMFLKFLIDYLQSQPPNEPPVYMGYVWAGLLAAMQFLTMIFSNASFYHANIVALKLRSALLSAIYDKGLVLSNKAKQMRSNGEVVNLMSLDAQKIGEICQFFHMGWSSAVQIAIALGFLFYLLGWVTFVGIGTMILLSPIQLVVVFLWSKFRETILALSDKRMKIITEVLQGISTIKFFNWESNYLQEVLRVRNKEVFKVFQSTFLTAMMNVCFAGVPIMVTLVTYIVYVAVGNPLDAAIIFASISYFNAIRLPLSMGLFSIQFTTEAMVSINRIQEYLTFDQNEPLNFGTDTDVPIKIEDCTFEWEKKPEEKDDKKNKKDKKKKQKKKKQSNKDEKSVTIELEDKKVEDKNEQKQEESKVGKLENISLEVKKGELLCIVGKVGSGKSSLISGIIGEMKKVKGKVTINGDLAYCPQQAWIQNVSLRDNITLGNELDKERYEQAIDLCALRRDLEILPAGDLTEIGEKGINLSGGQRQRVSLARAVYQNKDIYIFDDPLSAVDAHVGRHIFEKCICSHLKDKTRILVTHQLQYLKYASRIIVIDDGKIIEQGTFDELSTKKDGHLQRLLAEYSVQSHEQQEKKETEKKQETNKDSKKEEEEKAKNAKLMQEEERAKGFISMKVIWAYIQAGGGPLVLLFVLIFFAINQFALVASDIWMSLWIEQTFPVLNSWIYPWSYMIIYAGIGISSSIITFFRSLVMFIFGMFAANGLFKQSFKRVIRSPKEFFDTTPVGRILNRFSKDQDVLDSILIQNISASMEMAVAIASVFIIIGVTNYWMVIPLVPIFIGCVLVQQMFARSSREVKRLESLSRSPLFSHFSETLTGISTIRAYKLDEQFKAKNLQNVDNNLKCWFAHDMAQRWLAIRLETLSALMVSLTAIVIVATRGMMDPAFAGLSLSYALQISVFISWAVIQFTETESQMNSVERVVHYTKLDIESTETIKKENEPPKSWPEKGEIIFDNFQMRYRSGLELVLKGINLHIKPQEKIGIVGRTGAGKSTLMLALYRLVEGAGGSITIDGRNIRDINLSTLRKRLSIIPQEPILFSGTVRSNLDPFKEYDDKVLWDALERAHLKEKIEKLDKKLDAAVSSGGENFSVGERQLLCLARALCRSTKILLIDECTANVDLETDHLIQKTIDKEFANCTRLTIAHRLNTVITSDRILVLDKGLVAEFDTPKALLSNEKSLFTELVNQTGSANAKLLKNMVLGESKPEEGNIKTEEKRESISVEQPKQESMPTQNVQQSKE